MIIILYSILCIAFTKININKKTNLFNSEINEK